MALVKEVCNWVPPPLQCPLADPFGGSVDSSCEGSHTSEKFCHSHCLVSKYPLAPNLAYTLCQAHVDMRK